MRSDVDEAVFEDLITQLFRRVRQPFKLGMREYLAALDVLQGDFELSGREELQLILQLLWCHSLPQQRLFEQIWHEVAQQVDSSSSQSRSDVPDHRPSSESLPSVPLREEPMPAEMPQPRLSQPELEPLALQPPLPSADIEDLPELQTYWPILRRSMAYAWRYLRRPRPDGPLDVLDIESTVDHVAKAGFFLSPVYHRREINHASLLLLIDQDGSMTPFHRFSRDLAETAQGGGLTRVDVYYFHNVPTTHVYRDPRLTEPIALQEIWPLCDGDTSVLIFSDAGAARGGQHIERVRSTTEFLVPLQQRTELIGWLNPMPVDRWNGTSAELIAYLVAMEQMDQDGFSNLIEIIRGQPLQSAQG
ncbi:VWA containing CoxE family protein [Leptolyngbya cf. ectocarpi LEGE 11479]|uniref:VWA containing CoxE family protein n=1 Tax=Leptolyngbya cf. ectocarpi LEGE 11479 TaxID=1828722 RepID=A0A929FB86_LEPEC|nr:VWA containing CoxE family protein [Leptolyngbya ectocarpi]MBE9070536.1 VWA containing CoxE family protein [Leptolyngbya cf. ectocarpi LEGE 11479]